MTTPAADREAPLSYLLIVNPVAGKGAGAARAEALRTALAHDHHVDVLATTGRGDATRLVRAHGGTVDRVIAIGGDGTLNEVLRGVLDLGTSAETRPCLGFLPGGTANVATKAFGFIPEPARLARALPGMRGSPVDVGIVEMDGHERPFLLWCGAGLDAVVIEELNASRTGHMGMKGLVMSAPRVFSAISRYSRPGIGIEVDGEELPRVTSVVLANVADMAFGGTLHAGATPFDGEVDVVMIERAGSLATLAYGMRMLYSSLTTSFGVSHRPGRHVVLRSDGDVPVQVDGEPAGQLPLDVRMIRGAVRLLIPDPQVCVGPDVAPGW